MMRKRKIIGIIGLVLILVIVLFYVVRIQPMVKEYKKIAYDKLANIDEDTFAKLENTKVYGKNGELIGEVNSGSYQYKKISEISKYVQDGYIAVEDKNFKSHHGIDYLATVRAGIKLVLNRGKATQGGSTITQQLVKNSFLSQEKTFTRKIAEFFLAPEIEKMYTKPQIMEYYCNSNYYGNRCYGIGNAASYYFHKNADQLTLSEAALLVGLSNNPSRYDPVTNYNSSIRKRDRVLKHMLDAKVISKTQYQQAKNEKIEIAEYRKNVKPEGYQTSFAIYQATLELMKKNGFEFQYTFQDKEDEKQYKEIKEKSNPKLIEKEKINFVYAGEIFSKLRNVNPFIYALNVIKNENIDLYNKLKIMFFGNIDSDEVKNKLNVIDKVSVSPRIPYDEALGYMLNSQVLLLFGNKNSKQIPAKVYDYFGAEGLIFVILGDENDPIKDVVKNKEKCIVVNNNVDEIVNGINKIASMIELGIKHGAIEEYKWQYISKRLNDILRG